MCCCSAARSLRVKPRVRLIDGHQRRPAARTSVPPAHVDGADGAGPRYEVGLGTKWRPVGLSLLFAVSSPSPPPGPRPPPDIPLKGRTRAHGRPHVRGQLRRQRGRGVSLVFAIRVVTILWCSPLVWVLTAASPAGLRCSRRFSSRQCTRRCRSPVISHATHSSWGPAPRAIKCPRPPTGQRLTCFLR